MESKSAAMILSYLEKLLTEYLEELNDVTSADKNQFAYGEKTAYVECLEIIQHWSKAEMYGLNYKIEERFPLM